MYRDINSDARILGSLEVQQNSSFYSNVVIEGSLELGDIQNVESAINSKLASSFSSLSQDLVLGGKITLTSPLNSLKLKPSSDNYVLYENEPVTFDEDSKTLQNSPVDALSEVVKSSTSGGDTYVRGADYTVDYFTGVITRISDGSISSNQTVYVDYYKTVNMITITNPSDSDIYFSIDNRGNIYGKSITVNLSSYSTSQESEIEGSFNISGNLTVSGHSFLGGSGSDVYVYGELGVYSGLDTVFYVDSTGKLTTGTVPWARLSGVPTSFEPSSHASSATTYGVGTSTQYGHLKLGSGEGDAAPGNHSHSHSDLSSVTEDDHHNKVHGINSSDHSGTPLNVSNGGTGLTSVVAGRVLYGAGTSALGNSEKLSWDGSSLGIGTSSPVGTLNILNSSGVTDSSTINQYLLTLSCSSDITGTEAGISFRIDSSQNNTRTPGAAIVHKREGNHSLGSLLFKTVTGTTGSSPLATRMIIDEAGYVGINTNDPLQNLDINGNIRIRGDVISNKTSLNFKNDQGNPLPVKISSLVLGDYSKSAPSDGLYVHGKVQVDTSNDNYQLEVGGDIRTTGTLRADAINVASTSLVTNLNADKLDNYDSGDIFGLIANTSGNGVISGCEVSETTPSSSQVRISEGQVFLGSYGLINLGAENITPGIPAGQYGAIYINSSGLRAVTDPYSTLSSALAAVPLTGVLLAVVHPVSGSSILNNHIYSMRKFVSIQESDNYLRFFRSDRINATVASSSHTTLNRADLYKDGDRVRLRLTDIPNSSGVFKRTIFNTDSISMVVEDNSGYVSEHTITPTKISTWDDAGGKKHVHYYNTTFNETPNGVRTSFTLSTGHVPGQGKIMVYKNGLRQSPNIDYTCSGSSVTFMVAPLVNDNILADYVMG